MDKNALIVLKTDLTNQMMTIKVISERLAERAQGITPEDPVRLESVAYQIHNLYNATEDFLKLVAAHFENQIADTARWHTLLLQRMSQEIPGIRPALLSQKTYILLNSLRGFRHFFRHAYGVPIDYEQLQINLNKSFQLYSCLDRDLKQFFTALE
ncbi:MAG: hypothetical protein AAGF26_20520 [Cyanobacteria bacterium P01_G01_bin.49]